MEAINSFENIFVIVRNLDCINEITKNYGRKVKVISILIYADKQFTEERLKLVGREDEIPTRLNRMNQVLSDYFSELSFFDRIILLNDASEEHLKMQLNQLIKKCEIEPYNSLYVSPNQSYNLIKPLIGYKENIYLQLDKFPFEKNIFLMMKFRDDTRCNYTNTKIMILYVML